MMLNSPPASNTSRENRHTEIATLMAGTNTTDTLLQAAASDGKKIYIFVTF